MIVLMGRMLRIIILIVRMIILTISSDRMIKPGWAPGPPGGGVGGLRGEAAQGPGLA